MNPRRKLFTDRLRQILGDPYIWGGKGGPWDCSGAMVSCLNASGGFNIDPANTGSRALYDLFAHAKINPAIAQPGTLFFYSENPPAVAHVMACLTRWPNGNIVLAGAHRGTRATIDLEMATHQAACVSIVCGGLDYWRKGFVAALDPFGGQP